MTEKMRKRVLPKFENIKGDEYYINDDENIGKLRLLGFLPLTYKELVCKFAKPLGKSCEREIL